MFSNLLIMEYNKKLLDCNFCTNLFSSSKVFPLVIQIACY